MKKIRKTALGTTVLLVVFAAVLAIGACAAEYLVPMGTAVGIQMNVDGVLVVDTMDITLSDGSCVCPAREAGIQPGDVITELDGQATETAAQLEQAAAQLDGGEISVTLRRGGETLQIRLQPAQSEQGPRLGLWLRDSVAGVGTVTYFDPQTQRFGALGHAVTDGQTSAVLPLSGGSVSSACIVDVRLGCAGSPGALSGVFDLSAAIGTVEKNTLCGIFGTLEQTPAGEAVPVAAAEEVHEGGACILSSVTEAGVDCYEVQISRCAGGGQLELRVTDETLLSLTGGIVQGMSGSPILQDGKLVGAVTHVLVNDPTRGYGIFIGDMLAAAG